MLKGNGFTLTGVRKELLMSNPKENLFYIPAKPFFNHVKHLIFNGLVM